jgi:hypothetical protein
MGSTLNSPHSLIAADLHHVTVSKTPLPCDSDRLFSPGGALAARPAAGLSGIIVFFGDHTGA